ncbi:hypothetical protein ACIRJR_25900 [Streptomyces sp. NPDC102402]|uniref:hypothetical protein n=1 Tax=Streptomyces sp. NPDC102402 TaxID=3366169 RepID=UPI00380339B5
MQELRCEVLLNADRGQHLAVRTAEPGRESYERLRLPRAIGLRDPGAPGPVDRTGA